MPPGERGYMGSSADDNGPERTVRVEGSDTCADSVHVRETGVGGTGPGITNRPPPPKHKNNSVVTEPGFAGFSSLDCDERDESEGGDEDANEDVDAALERETNEFCDTILRLTGVRALDVARQSYTLFLDEHQSDLGEEEHRLAVLRRIQCGEPGAVLLDGKSYLLTEAAHGEEVAMATQVRRIQREES